MWFYAKDGEQHGPVEADDIRSRQKSGELSNATLVWKEGMAQWSPLEEVLELREPVPSEGESVAEGSPSVPNLAQAPAAAPMNQPAPQLIAPVQQNTMALVSMILGIISIALCMMALTGIPAVICGHIARKQFRESPVPQSGEGMALTGLILGYVAIAITVAYIVFMVIIFAGAASAASSIPPTPAPPFSPAP